MDSFEPLVFVTNIMEKQKLFCKNRSRKCTWQGSLNQLENHLENGCEFQMLNCGNEDCTTQVMRKDLEDHHRDCEFRQVKCSYCEKDVSLAKLPLHFNDCGKYPLDCEQDCGAKIERAEMKKHFDNVCDNTKLNCPYAKYGCQDHYERKAQSDHLQMNYDKHNLLTIQYFEKFQEEVLTMINRTKKNGEEIKERMNQNEKKLSDLSKKMTEVENLDSLGKKTVRTGNSAEPTNFKRKKELTENNHVINY